MYDPAIDEIRAVRQQISAAFGHDSHRLIAYYRDMQKNYRGSAVREELGSAADGGEKDTRTGPVPPSA